MKKYIKGKFVNTIMRFSQILTKENSIVFTSFDGKQYSCNPRAISEAIHNLDSKIKIYWIFKDMGIECPSYITKIKKGSVLSLIKYARAKVWIDNCNKPNYYFKSTDQLYMQTWHGDCGFKTLVEENNICKFDVGVTSCSFGEKYVYKEAFHFNGPLLKWGSPRNDLIINGDEDLKNNVLNELKISNGTHVLFFAPTFKDSKVGDNANIFLPFDEKKLLDELEQSTNEKWVLLYRGHHVTQGKMIFRDCNRVFDVTNYADISQLYIISDILITDYSSCCCDFIMSNKPALLYHWDHLNYINMDRKLKYSDQELPFYITYKEDELINKVKEVSLVDCTEYCSQIKEFFGSYESGRSSILVAEYLRDWIYYGKNTKEV